MRYARGAFVHAEVCIFAFDAKLAGLKFANAGLAEIGPADAAI